MLRGKLNWHCKKLLFNLLTNPNEEFRKISNYFSKILKQNFSDKKIKNSIESNSFNNLKRMETLSGFNEFITHDNRKFFNLGPENKWKNFLQKSTVDEIESKFYNEMKELGYL